MKCPACGAAELAHDTRDLTLDHGNGTVVVPEVTGAFCPACGEAVLEADQAQRVSAVLLAAREACAGNGH